MSISAREGTIDASLEALMQHGHRAFPTPKAVEDGLRHGGVCHALTKGTRGPSQGLPRLGYGLPMDRTPRLQVCSAARPIVDAPVAMKPQLACPAQ